MGRRARKRHIQQSIRFRDKNGQLRGGKRPGAGRPKKGARASERHKKRPALAARYPVHSILRVAKDVGSLRQGYAYHAIREALEVVKRRADFRVVEISIQRYHVHLVVEATNELALARGMQSLQISAARKLNAAISKHRGRGRSGCVFVDRYHARILRTPRDVRHVLNYVLNNWRHHGEHKGFESVNWDVDWFSSAPRFAGWKEPSPTMSSKYHPLGTCGAETWLLRIGWLRAGPPISMYAVPGRDCYEGAA
jgi:REP element-mobilizing transposase RayT